jgi:signal transduction histidine kinase/sensor domain CHASE-containing protein/FixJ family two-component response regulator/HPt (histidine-containing phosphotransfer) domain-containing protein
VEVVVSIRKKIILILIAVIELYSLIIYGIETKIILPHFNTYQNQEAAEDLDRCIQLIDKEVESIAQINWDWSNWDDTYQYVVDKNPEYVKSTLSYTGFEGNKLNLIYICNLNGDVVWGKIYDLNTKEPIELSQFPPDALGLDHILLQYDANDTNDVEDANESGDVNDVKDSVIKGIYMTDKGPMLISSRAILTSDSEGPSHGTMIMGRFLDQNIIQDLRTKLSSNFNVRPFTAEEIANWEQNPLSRLSEKQDCTIDKYNAGQLLVRGFIRGIDGQPALLVNDYVPTTIMLQGKRAMKFAMLSMLFAGVIIVLTIYWLVKKLVLSRLEKIRKTINNVVKTGDYSLRTHLNGKDELASLAEDVNCMLAHTTEVEQKIIHAKQEWERTFDVVPDMITIINENHRIVRINKSMASRLGITPAQAVGELCYKLIDCSNEPPPNCPHVQFLADGKEHVEEMYNKNIGGYFSVSVSPFGNIEDNAGCAVHVARDINERIITEHRLKADKEQAEILAHEAAAADAVKSQFLSNMSHEIRTPLNAIIGFSELLAEDNLTVEQKGNVDIIRDSASHLLALIGDVLDFSKIDANKMDIFIEECSLDKLCATAESMMFPQARAKGLAFELRHHGELPAKIHTDSIRLKQCLINLVSNAIKFTEKGGVYVDVSMENINRKPYIRFDVTDTGIGIPADKHNAIFDAFVQGDSTTTRQYGGTGLGLTITKKLARLLDGDVRLTSLVGKGSVFSLIIPANVDEKFQPIEGSRYSDKETFVKNDSPQPAADNESFCGRILIAEDTASNALLMTRVLEKRGLDVTVVSDGAKAVEKALEQKYDIILMDMQMPGMDGYEAAKRLRDAGITTPIVAQTAYAMSGDQDKCLAAGCSDYISKPVSQGKLIDIVRKYINGQKLMLDTKIDSLESEVQKITTLCSGNACSQPCVNKSVENDLIDEIIDWAGVMERIPEDSIEEIMSVCIADNRDRLKLTAKAVEAADAKEIKSLAHAIKGSTAAIGAKCLSQAAANLEKMAANNDLSNAEQVVQVMQSEFGKLESFISQPNWYSQAKRRMENKMNQVS